MGHFRSKFLGLVLVVALSSSSFAHAGISDYFPNRQVTVGATMAAGLAVVAGFNPVLIVLYSLPVAWSFLYISVADRAIKVRIDGLNKSGHTNWAKIAHVGNGLIKMANGILIKAISKPSSDEIDSLSRQATGAVLSTMKSGQHAEAQEEELGQLNKYFKGRVGESFTKFSLSAQEGRSSISLLLISTKMLMDSAFELVINDRIEVAADAVALALVRVRAFYKEVGPDTMLLRAAARASFAERFAAVEIPQPVRFADFVAQRVAKMDRFVKPNTPAQKEIDGLMIAWGIKAGELPEEYKHHEQPKDQTQKQEESALLQYAESAAKYLPGVLVTIATSALEVSPAAEFLIGYGVNSKDWLTLDLKTLVDNWSKGVTGVLMTNLDMKIRSDVELIVQQTKNSETEIDPSTKQMGDEFERVKEVALNQLSANNRKGRQTWERAAIMVIAGLSRATDFMLRQQGVSDDRRQALAASVIASTAIEHWANHNEFPPNDEKFAMIAQALFSNHFAANEEFVEQIHRFVTKLLQNEGFSEASTQKALTDINEMLVAWGIA